MRISGKKEQMEHSISSGHKPGNKLGTMRRMTIDNQKHRPVGVTRSGSF
jgi:hypothetical protein